MVAAYGWVASTTASIRVVAQPVPQSVDTAEATDAHRSDGQRRVGHPARQRADDVDSGVQPGRQRAGLGGAAEQQDRISAGSPRRRPAEYR